jgi:TM2 domain-containing membrane protein YozV
LPRSSPSEAFDELINEQPSSSLAAFAKEAKTIPWKSKETAAIRSLIPGLGQMYLGETRNGLVRLGIAVASFLAAAAPVYAAAHGGHNSSLDVAAGIGGLIVLSFDFTSSYEDTMHGVVRWNERVESEFNRAHPSAP